MQLKNFLTLSLLAVANASPLSRAAARSKSLQARDPPNLPKDLDSYGLKGDSWEKKFYDALVKWEDDKVDDGAGMDKYWGFWCGPNVEEISGWVKEFNDGKYHEGLAEGDDKKMTIPGEVYPDIESVEDLQNVQIDWMDDKEDQLNKIAAFPIAMMSWRGAQRAAQAGGHIRYVGKEGEPDLPEKRIWSTVEAFELTKEGTKIESITRYNLGKGADGKKEIWKKGDKPLGEKVNFEKWGVNEDEAKKAFAEEVGEGKFEEVKEHIKDEAD